MDIKNLIIRTISGAILVAAIVSSILINEYTMCAFFALIAMLATREFFVLTSPHTSALRLAYAALMTTFPMAMVQTWIPQRTKYVLIFVYIILFALWFIVELFKKERNVIHNCGCKALSQVYIAFPFASLALLYNESTLLPLLVFVLIWTNDTFAYLVGCTLGKHKMAPTISPGKSWEGFAGGALFAIGAAAVFTCFAQFDALGLSAYEFIIIAAAVVVFGTLGDLMESALKRQLGVKDSGRIIPGHGGLLDRFDSIILAAPTAYALVILFKHIA